jgi:hypothetical protein
MSPGRRGRCYRGSLAGTSAFSDMGGEVDDREARPKSKASSQRATKRCRESWKLRVGEDGGVGAGAARGRVKSAGAARPEQPRGSDDAGRGGGVRGRRRWRQRRWRRRRCRGR